MKYNFIVLFFSAFICASSFCYAQKQCVDEKLLGTFITNAQLQDYIIEEVIEVLSEVIFTVNGKELRLVADPQDIERLFKGKKERKFKIAYEKVFDWLVDRYNEYKRISSAQPIR